ncbi:MFS transporter [Caldibacillus thermolactis]|jgi:MFS transporter, DHA1 family, multidrug resistance protein B|uniref:MFS transporter n=1 Tax=Pallidibacillus thermolactis TaxID=251051 RepID=A0ABT2WG68_9BACI|nr:MFS transporter [Pallidibacillus thermolactis]MCU9594417.1 MFS transporter [Pallidibacillus thermolactis]MCU9601217.1 MFS transporter [Pallidibacillus thermolactis subsp. kokeshiiformis]MED1672354.1 MFS transporter [Pallidibacillus thermolactis subsp. kokeshiiformis]
MNFFRLHRTVKIRLIESFLSSAVSNMIFPFMAIYLSSYFGVKITGILLFINVLVGILLSFFGGYISDSFGRKKLIVFAETIRLMAFFIMMLCNSPWFFSPEITFLMMMVNTICWSLADPANDAMLIDVSKPHERKFVFSLSYWGFNLAVALGGVLGGFLFKDYLFELLIALTVTAAITVILITFFIDESYIVEKKEKESLLKHVTNMIRNYRTVFRDRLFILYTVALILIMSLEYQLNNYIGIRLENEMNKQPFFHWEIDGILMAGLLRTENTILVVLMALFATAMVTRFKDRHVMVLSSFFFVAGYAFVSYSNSIPLLFFAMFIASVAEVLRVPVEQNYIASLPPKHARSSYLAINGMGYYLSQLICSITVMISAYLSSALTSIFIAITGLFGVLILLKIGTALDKRLEQAK